MNVLESAAEIPTQRDVSVDFSRCANRLPDIVESEEAKGLSVDNRQGMIISKSWAHYYPLLIGMVHLEHGWRRLVWYIGELML